MEAIILAGGIGSRLKSVVADVPKPMALVGNKPFLTYIIDYLIEHGITKVILSIGYKASIIQDYFGEQYQGISIEYAIEKERLGTGGAIKNAMQYASDDYVLVTNGDSIFKANITELVNIQNEKKADVTIALKKMFDFERYGSVLLNNEQRILQFEEKKPLKEGLINTGVYIFNRKSFEAESFPKIFSIEKEYFEKHDENRLFIGVEQEGYFLDIGIPQDYRKADFDLNIKDQVDETWTLFLDRDGVINKKIDGDYVRNTDQFEWLEGSLESIVQFGKTFGRIIVVTNQQGIGKGLMTEEALQEVHNYLCTSVKSKGGHIDAVYFAPNLVSEHSPMRKPGIGMALKAKEEFSEIDFSKSLMIGDSISDMEFAINAGIFPIFLNKIKNDRFLTLESLSAFREILFQ